MKRVSVIMPSLNVKSYIKNAIESVMSQSLEDIEIICVDAFSEDGTWEILHSAAAADERITLIRTHCRSYGYQVNLGLSIARGEYIAIVETDDYVSHDMYESLYNVAVKNNLDYIKADYMAYWTQKNGERFFLKRKNPEHAHFYNQILCPKDHPSLGADDWYLWTGIFKRKFIEDNKIQFHESPGAAFQDIGFLVRTMQSAKRAMYVKNTFYNYCCDREEASSRMGMSLKLAYREFKSISDSEIKLAGGEELFYSRMAKSFIYSISELKEEDIHDSENAEAYQWFLDRLKGAIADNKLRKDTIAKAFWERVHIILARGKEYLKDEDNKKREFILKLKKEGDSSSVVIFGCGNYGYGAYQWMLQEEIDIAGFMDNNSLLWGTEIDGIPVYSPQDISSLSPDFQFLIANADYASDIQGQLIHLGVKPENIHICR